MPLPWRDAEPSPETRAAAHSRLGALPASPPGWVPLSSAADPGRDEPEPPDASHPPHLPEPTPSVTTALGEGLLDRLPGSLRAARLAPGLAGALALAAVGAVAVAVSLLLFLRARPHPVAVPRVTSSAAAAVTLVVDVAGRVRRPGIVTLPLGSRVGDALRAAGGALQPADIGMLNLARKLVDGEQVVVGAAPAVAGAAGDAGPAAGLVPGAAAPLDLNAATVSQLDQLPGVGPVLAQRIVDFRTAHGPFTRVDQLRQVPGIGDRKYDDLHTLVRV